MTPQQNAEMNRLCEQLIALLERLIELQTSLHEATQAKLHAMRIAEPGAMEAASVREGELAAEAGKVDGRRRLVVTALCSLVGQPKIGINGEVTLRALAARLQEPARSRLLQLAAALRERMLLVAEANRVVEIVSREMLAHFKTLFEIMTTDDEAVTMYSARGQVAPKPATKVLDAVG